MTRSTVSKRRHRRLRGRLRKAWAQGVNSGDAGEIDFDALKIEARDKALENWLRQEAVPSYDAMKADRSRGRSVSDVRGSLVAEHERGEL